VEFFHAPLKFGDHIDRAFKENPELFFLNQLITPDISALNRMKLGTGHQALTHQSAAERLGLRMRLNACESQNQGHG